MKRHHIAAGFFIIFGALSVSGRFHNGDINGAILTGTMFTVLGAVALFYERWRYWLRPIAVAAPVILMGIVVYQDLQDGDLSFGIVGMLVLALGVLLTIFQDKPFVKERIRPWLRPIPFVALGILLIGALFSLVW